ncbi:DUF6275 family protein [Clostridium sp. HCP1S3_B4]|uniref:DUF6275 family protein n=1 Tax=unclassified Clostridium TaxID=2614128 RepID=UPI003F8C95E6
MQEFIQKSKDIVLGHLNMTDRSPDEVYVVWSCKTLQNKKAILSTDLVNGILFEITYNGDKDETYVDVYKKEKNYVVK